MVWFNPENKILNENKNIQLWDYGIKGAGG